MVKTRPRQFVENAESRKKYLKNQNLIGILLKEILKNTINKNKITQKVLKTGSRLCPTSGPITPPPPPPELLESPTVRRLSSNS